MSVNRVLIAGCGRLGRELGLQLSRSGHRVHGLRRSAEKLPGELLPVAADLADPAGLAELPESDRVVFAATAGESTEAAYRRIYVSGLGHLLDAIARQARRPRLVFVSSTAVYEADDGCWVDEDTPCRPGGFRGRVLLEAEALALEACATVVRFGGIYGPGPGALLGRVRRGAACRPGRYTNRIHVTDAAGALAHLLETQQNERVFLAVDDYPAPECEVMDWLADRLAVPRPARDDAEGGRGKRCRNERLGQTGFRFRYPDYRAGYGAMLSGEVE